MQTLLSDLRYALRGIRKNPGFALLIVLTLGLGIGANTAIFSVVNGVLLRPLPYRDSDRLVEIRSQGPGGRMRFGISYPDYQDLQGLKGSLAGVAIYTNERYNLTGGTEPQEVVAALVSPQLFGVLGSPPTAGRVFAADEERAPVAILSHRLWRKLFNADPAAVGRQVSLDGHDFTVVGVMPSGFAFPEENVAVWLPIGWAFAQDAQLTVNRSYHAFNAVARLAPGAGLDRLRGDLDLLARRIAAARTDNGGRRMEVRMQGGPDAGPAPGGAAQQAAAEDAFVVTTLREEVVGNVQGNLLILLGAVGLVLLIGCANAANLLMARAGTRRREMGIRTALGAGRMRLVRQLLTESVVLALAAAGAGLVLASWGVHLLLTAWPRTLPRTGDIHLDLTVLGFTLGLAILTGLLFGFLPAFRLAAPGVTESLRDEPGSGARQRRRTQATLVVVEVALALMLVVGAGLLVRSFLVLNSVQLGFQPDDLLAARVRLTPSRYPNATAQRQFFTQITARLRDRPGVTGVSLARTLPLSGARMMMAMDPRDVHPGDPDTFLPMGMTIVGPEFFSTMQIPLRRGRPFTAEDREGAPPVIIVNQRLARRLWPGENALGKQLPVSGPGDRERRATVVGVIGDLRASTMADGPAPEVFLPAAQFRDMPEMWVLLRATNPLRQVPALREVVRQADAGQPIGEVVTFGQMIQRQESARRFNMTLITLFAALALVLAVIGIAGLTAYAVSQRKREIGIRISLGARDADVLKLLLRDSTRLVVLGVVLGLAGALLVAPVLSSLLYGISSRDATSFAAAGTVLIAVALLATWIPARRALRVDPMTVLREE